MGAVRAQRWLISGLSCLVSALALALGTDGWFSPALAVFGALVACVGLHRLGRSGARGLSAAVEAAADEPRPSN
jgi:hypothetical protein